MLFSYQLRAEYRAYQYLIKSSNFSNTIVSTKNPVTFEAYHGGPQNIQVTLLKTWMCKGYTGNFRPICDAPEKKLLEALKEKKTKTNR